jgi:hypothetical protein
MWESMREVDRPVPLKYDDFVALLGSPLSVYQLLEGAMGSFSEAKSRCDVLLKDSLVSAPLLELARAHVVACQRVSAMMGRLLSE